MSAARPFSNSLVFQHFCAFEPFLTMTVWFWDPSFHTEDNWGIYYRRLTLTDAPEGKTCIKNRGWKLLNRMWNFFLFCLNIIFFHLVLPFRGYRGLLHVSQKTKLVKFTLIFKFRMFSNPRLLKVPYCTPFWSFILGFDVLKNIYSWYKYQKPSQYIFTALFSGAVVKKTGRFGLSN